MVMTALRKLCLLSFIVLVRNGVNPFGIHVDWLAETWQKMDHNCKLAGSNEVLLMTVWYPAEHMRQFSTPTAFPRSLPPHSVSVVKSKDSAISYNLHSTARSCAQKGHEKTVSSFDLNFLTGMEARLLFFRPIAHLAGEKEEECLLFLGLRD